MKPANSQELKEPVLLTPKQIKSLLETKKRNPTDLKLAMARFTYRTLAHLETVDESIPEQTFTGEQYPLW